MESADLPIQKRSLIILIRKEDEDKKFNDCISLVKTHLRSTLSKEEETQVKKRIRTLRFDMRKNFQNSQNKYACFEKKYKRFLDSPVRMPKSLLKESLFPVQGQLKKILQQLTFLTSNCNLDCRICEEYVSKLSEHIESSHENIGNLHKGQKRGNRNLRTRKPINYKKMQMEQPTRQDSESESEHFIQEFNIKEENFFDEDNDEDFNPGDDNENYNTGCQSEEEHMDVDTEDLDEEDTHPYECNICLKKFTLERSVYRHRRNIHKETTLPCLVCQETFPDTQGLNDHVLKFHPKRPDPSRVKKAYECDICQTQFTHHYSLIKHQRNIHKVAKSYACQVCPEKFSTKNDLQDHKRLSHQAAKSRDFLCTDCGKTFTYQHELNRHSLIHTKFGEKTFKCTHEGCSSSFHLKDHLRRHMRYHGEKSYGCTVCDKSFNLKEGLVNHLRVHSGERPFKCPECSQSFKARYSLCVHRKCHEGVKSHICETCGKAFRLKHQLITHSRIHTGEKKYVCQDCGTAFRQPAHLKTHRKIHNKIGIPSNSNQFGNQNQELELEIQTLFSDY